MLTEADLDRQVKQLSATMPGVPLFVCRNILIQDQEDYLRSPKTNIISATTNYSSKGEAAKSRRQNVSTPTCLHF